MKPYYLLLLLPLLAIGCSTPVNTVEPQNPQATPEIVDSRVEIFDNSLARRLSLVQVAEAEDNGFLRIQATFRNRQVRPRSFAYKFDWIRENGMEVTSPASVWRRSHVEGGQTVSVSALAPTTDVVDFRLSLREIN